MFPETAFPMDKKREVPQTTITDEESSDSVPKKSVPPNSGEEIDVFEDWLELQRVTKEAGESLETLFDKGWKPFLKSKSNGKQYIGLRLQGKDPETGKHIDTERSLGLFDPEHPERYGALRSLYPVKLPVIVPRLGMSQIPRDTQGNLRASILTTKVGRVAPIGPSVQLELETLNWFTWAQKKADYPGTLDNFINVSVSTLFREHYKLELAVINQKEENC